jgi:hypothetical protein
MLKQHKAAPMGEQPGQGEELEMLVVIGTYPPPAPKNLKKFSADAECEMSQQAFYTL